jgi:hypothetical protein
MRLRPRAERRSRRQQQQRDALFDLPGGGSYAHVPRPDHGAQSGAHEAREGKTMTTQALPPSVDQQLADTRTASAQAQGRIAELEAIVVKERARADRAEAEAGLLYKTLQEIRRDVRFAHVTIDNDGKWAALCEDIMVMIDKVTPNHTAGATEARRLWDEARARAALAARARREGM